MYIFSVNTKLFEEEKVYVFISTEVSLQKLKRKQTKVTTPK